MTDDTDTILEQYPGTVVCVGSNFYASAFLQCMENYFYVEILCTWVLLEKIVVVLGSTSSTRST